MKSFARVLFILAASGLLAAGVQAQPTPKIMVVDMAKLYDGHYRTEEQNIKLRSDMQKAQEELDRLNKEGNDLIEKYKESLEMAKNPALNDDAKGKATQESQARLQQIQQKQGERETFTQTVDERRQEQVKKFRDYLLGEISKIATDIAKKKGATILIDKAGPSLFGISNVLFFDPAYDITDDVMQEINKGRPANAPAATAPANATPATSAAPSGGAPLITVPGAKK